MATDLRLYLGGVLIDDGMTITYAQAQKAPIIEWAKKEGVNYAVAMWDLDASNFIHYLVTGVTTINRGTRVIPYMSPKPPSGTHRYVIEVHQLNHPDSFSTIYSRTQGDIVAALADHPLVYRFMFKVSS